MAEITLTEWLATLNGMDVNQGGDVVPTTLGEAHQWLMDHLGEPIAAMPAAVVEGVGAVARQGAAYIFRPDQLRPAVEEDLWF